MKKLSIFLKTLLVAVGIGVGSNAWGATETLTGSDSPTKDTDYAKTSFTVLGKYWPDKSNRTINSKECLKVRWNQKDASTGNETGFALRVKDGYKITGLTAQMSGNGNSLTLSSIKIDGVAYTGSYTKTIPANDSYVTITLTDIEATEYINFVKGSGDATQGYVDITVTYEERSKTVKETFDFHTMITAGYSSANTSPSQSVSYYLYSNSTTTTETNSAKLNYLYNSAGDRYSIGSHIYLYAHASNADLSNTNYWWIRTGNSYNVLYNNKTNQNQRFAIVGLSKGDKFTITFATGQLAFQTANVYLESDGTKTNVTASSTVDDCTSVQSGETYVVSDDALGEDGAINVALVTKKANVSISKIVIERPSVTETIDAPTFNVAYNGANRTVTIIDGETNSLNSGVKTYYTTDGSTPTTSSTKYTAPLDISEDCTVKAISVAVNGTISSVGSQEVTVGKLTVAAPTITLSSMETNGDFYSPKFVIANGDNSSIFGLPTPILSATYNGSAVDISSGYYVPSSVGTLVVTAAADNYISTSTEKEIEYAIFTCQSTPNFNEIALTDLATTLGGTWGDIYNDRWAEWTRGAGKSADLSAGISGDNNYAMSNLSSSGSVEVGDWFTFTRNRGSSALTIVAGYGLGEKGFAPTMKISSAIEGGIVEYAFGKNNPSTTYYFMSSDDETTGYKNFSLSAANVLKYCKYYKPLTFALSSGEAQHLTFHNVGSGSNNNDNWMIDVFNNDSRIGAVRADWWDNVTSGNDNFTNPYTWSSDGGITAAGDINWTTFLSDTQDADCDFTLSYTGGTLYIIGSITKDNDVYYVNYSKGSLTGDIGIYLYGNNATLSSISYSSTDVNTILVAPSYAITGTIASSGYSSLASAYGLDFANATGLTAAYVVTKTTTDAVTLTSVDEIPANQGVILKGTPGATYNIPVKADAAYAGANLLSAAVTATDIAANTAYILQGGQLHLVTAASTVPAGKAYLLASNVPSGARSMTFVFDDEATGVGASLMNNEERTMNNEVYDLQGRRVDGSRLTVNGSRLNPGIYIKNGRKVVVK